MDAKELRFGNFVRTTITHTNIKITIDELLEIINEPSEHQLEPIPLTEEWLLKFGVLFGFSHCGSQYDIEFGLDCYNLRLPYDIGMSKFIGEIKHVHQLQNLYFALTGEELESTQIEKI
jgi:hypothetical protein